MDHSTPENTAGLFLAHFDLGAPLGDGEDTIIYPRPHRAAMEAAALSGWTFRSYSSAETPGTQDDFRSHRITSFPTVILFRDGVERARLTCPPSCGADLFLKWGAAAAGR